MLTEETKGKCLDLKFRVAEGSNKPLLLAEAFEQLGLLRVGIDPEESIHVLKSGNLTRDQILTDCNNVFEGLGHTVLVVQPSSQTGMRPSAKPVQHAPPHVTVSLQHRVKATLDDLERKGILEKVAIPTDWFSSMVVVTTPNKIGICLDPKDLNRTVICRKYQLPTLDKLLPKLSRAKVFSTLNAKDGFYKLVWMTTAVSGQLSGPFWSLQVSEANLWYQPSSRI